MKIIYSYIFLSFLLFSRENIDFILNNKLFEISNNLVITDKIKLIYKNNNNNYLWINSSKRRNNLLKALNNIYFNYKKLDFNRDKILEYFNIYHNRIIINFNLKKFAKLDILLTSSYLLLIDFIINSNIDWNLFSKKLSQLKDKDGRAINTYWDLKHHKFPKIDDIYKSIINDNIPFFLTKITPFQKTKHNNLINTLKFYKNIKDYQNISFGKKIKLGDIDNRIIPIKKRLSIYGDYPIRNSFNNKFNDDLLRALYLYKERFNLIQDNMIDNITIVNLNRPIKKLINKILINLDKLKISQNNENLTNFVSINIPSFSMKLFLNRTFKMNIDVIIGRTTRPTPIFLDKISYLKINPYWFIPESLVRKDLIPMLKKNKNYLIENDIHIFNNWNVKSKKLKINLAKKLFPYGNTKKYIPYKFIQFPGEHNPLGRIKFMFPNKHSVYLHDTSHRNLFDYEYRLYSSGCIRIKKPFLLFEYMKSFIPKEHFNNIEKYLESKKNIRISLLKTLPIYTTYFTVFREHNRVYFRKDIYKYDLLIAESEKKIF